MLHVQPKSGDDSFGDFWRKERKTHSNDLGLTSDSHIEGALYERPFFCESPRDGRSAKRKRGSAQPQEQHRVIQIFVDFAPIQSLVKLVGQFVANQSRHL